MIIQPEKRILDANGNAVGYGSLRAGFYSIDDGLLSRPDAHFSIEKFAVGPFREKTKASFGLSTDENAPVYSFASALSDNVNAYISIDRVFGSGMTYNFHIISIGNDANGAELVHKQIEAIIEEEIMQTVGKSETRDPDQTTEKLLRYFLTHYKTNPNNKNEPST